MPIIIKTIINTVQLNCLCACEEMCTETECTKCLYRLHVRTLHKGPHAHQQDPNDLRAQRGREGGPVAQRTLPAQREVSLAFMLE